MYNIQTEAQILSRSELDIDKLRKRYLQKIDDINVDFVSPYIWAYEKYRHFLLKNSSLEILDPQFHYRPDYLSYYRYGSTTYWTILLFMNNMKCIEEFIDDEILIPTFSSISMLSELNDYENETVDLDKDVVSEKQYFQKLYTPSYKRLDNRPDIVYEEEQPLQNLKELFILTADQIENQYVKLSNEVDINTVVLRIKNIYFAPLYSVHYVIKEDGNDTLLSWARDDTGLGDGLFETLMIGSVLEVHYRQPEE